MSYRPEPLTNDEEPRRKRKRGARLKREPARVQPRGYGVRHAQTLIATLGRLWRKPLGTLLSVAAIGIALALPAGMSVVLDNVRALSGSWNGMAHMSVFLRQGVGTDKAHALAAQITRQSGIKDVAVISADEALAEFRKHSGFGDALKALDHNPLPAVLVVTPLGNNNAVLHSLGRRLADRAIVDTVRLDAEWLQRLGAIIAIVHRAVLVLGIVFACGVIIIIGNTIRLDIQNRRQEIEVSKLIGATNRFIRRPFLYAGLWYGIGGGLAAWILVSLSLWMLAEPVRYLAGLYSSDFALRGLDAGGVLALLLAGAALGWLGSWLAVTRHLGEIEPS